MNIFYNTIYIMHVNISSKIITQRTVDKLFYV
jgi:hypothetical protein